MLWDLCVSGSLDVVCTSKAVVYFFSCQPLHLGVQLVIMNLNRWLRALNPYCSIHVAPCSGFSCHHGTKFGLHSILCFAPLLKRSPFTPRLLVQNLIVLWFQNMVWRLVIMPGTFIYMQEDYGQIPCFHCKWNPAAIQSSTPHIQFYNNNNSNNNNNNKKSGN